MEMMDRINRHDDQVDAIAHAVEWMIYGDWWNWCEFLRVQWTFTSIPFFNNKK